MITGSKAEASRRARDEYDRRARELAEDRRRVLAKVTRACEATRRRITERGKAERERVSLELEAARSAARESCGTRRTRVRETVKAGKADAKAKRDRKLATARELAQLQREAYGVRKASAAGARVRKVERARESDDEVEHNIDRELVPLWREVKRGIRGTPKMSRTEAFLHWLEENQDEVWAMRQASVDRELDSLAAEEAAYYRDRAPVEEAIPF